MAVFQIAPVSYLLVTLSRLDCCCSCSRCPVEFLDPLLETSVEVVGGVLPMLSSRRFPFRSFSLCKSLKVLDEASQKLRSCKRHLNIASGECLEISEVPSGQFDLSKIFLINSASVPSSSPRNNMAAFAKAGPTTERNDTTN